MSDILPLQPERRTPAELPIEFPTVHPYSEQASLAAAEFRFGRLANNVPELQQEHVRIEQGATDLIRRFQIGSAFFEDPRRSLIFYSLALKNQRYQESLGQSDADRLRAEQGMVVMGTFLLAADHSHAYKKEFEEYLSQLGLSEGLRARQEREDAAIAKFEDRGLTADIQDYIESADVLTETKRRLLVDPMANETNLEMHVVPLGNPNWGLFEAAGKKASDYAAYLSWANNLRARVAQFEAESGFVAAAHIDGFAIRREDRRLMAFSSASAEALLASKAVKRPSTLAAYEVLQAKHLIRHEYVHTVGSVGVGPAVGKSLEELRADHFSVTPAGMGYVRLGNFFKDLDLLYGSGTHVGAMFDQVRDANALGEGTNIYEAVANAYGLETMAEIALLAPTGGARDDRCLYEVDMQKSLGGFGGVLARVAVSPHVDRRVVTERALEMYYKHRELLATDPNVSLEFEKSFLVSRYGSLLGALGLKHHMDAYAS